MTIETKYNIGDEVWFMYEGKVHHSLVYGIYPSVTVSYFDAEGAQCKYEYEEYRVRLYQGYTTDLDVEELYPTKEELLKSL